MGAVGPSAFSGRSVQDEHLVVKRVVVCDVMSCDAGDAVPLANLPI